MRRREFVALVGGAAGAMACVARAAAGEAADHRIPCRGHAFIPRPMGCRFKGTLPREVGSSEPPIVGDLIAKLALLRGDD